jgi:hypothetical protein
MTRRSRHPVYEFSGRDFDVRIILQASLFFMFGFKISWATLDVELRNCEVKEAM